MNFASSEDRKLRDAFTVSQLIRRFPGSAVLTFFIAMFISGSISATVLHLYGAVLIWICTELAVQLIWENYLTIRKNSDTVKDVPFQILAIALLAVIIVSAIVLIY